MSTATKETGAPAPSVTAIPISSLREHPQNPRKTFPAPAMAELEASITRNGILNPILARPLKGSVFQILGGARRYRAAKALGLETVPAILRELDDEAALEVVVIDNLQRADLHPLEEADGFHQLESLGHDVARIAERVGRSAAYVYDRLKLLSLVEAGQKLFRDGLITAGHAIILSRLKPADQKRAIGTPGNGPLLERERTVWNPDGQDGAGKPTYKAVSVRELQAWVDKHVRFETESAEPMLFPETVSAVEQAKEAELEIVPITHSHHVLPEAKDGKGRRTYGPQSWKRADGTRGAKQCSSMVQGVVVVGPGRGDAFPVCIDKKRCTVHWRAEIRESKKRVKEASKGGKTGEQRWEVEQRKRKEEQQRQEARDARWRKAVPRILEAVAEKVAKAPARADGQIGKILADSLRLYFGGSCSVSKAAASKMVPRGRTAEDLVRHLVFLLLAERAQQWRAVESFPKHAKAFGVDARKILDEVAPEPAAKVAKPKKPKPARKRATKKAARRGR